MRKTTPIIEYKRALLFEDESSDLKTIDELAKKGYTLVPTNQPIDTWNGEAVWLMQRWTGRDFVIKKK